MYSPYPHSLTPYHLRYTFGCPPILYLRLHLASIVHYTLNRWALWMHAMTAGRQGMRVMTASSGEWSMFRGWRIVAELQAKTNRNIHRCGSPLWVPVLYYIQYIIYNTLFTIYCILYTTRNVYTIYYIFNMPTSYQ